MNKSLKQFKNSEKFLGKAFDDICRINLSDGFEFEKVKIGKLPHPHFDSEAIEVLQPAWQKYYASTFSSEVKINIPKSIEKVIELINTWLRTNTSLCVSS